MANIFEIGLVSGNPLSDKLGRGLLSEVILDGIDEASDVKGVMQDMLFACEFPVWLCVVCK